jgi:ribosome-binding protein aMBF1 (putative translation factor)
MVTLIEARDEKGFSQRELAKRLNRADSFVGKIGSGEPQLNVLVFCKEVNALGTDAAEITRAVVKGG